MDHYEQLHTLTFREPDGPHEHTAQVQIIGDQVLLYRRLNTHLGDGSSRLQRAIAEPLSCPTCGAGPVTISCRGQEVSGYSSPEEDPVYSPAATTLILKCPVTTRDCSPIILAGTAQLTTNYFPRDNEDRDAVVLTAEFMRPAPSLLHNIAGTPDAIAELGREAGTLLFVSPAAAVNCLRSAAELTLDEIQVPRGHTQNDGKFVRYNLSSRIDKAVSTNNTYLTEPQINHGLKDLLHGLRILGNAGSHNGTAPVTATKAIEGGRILSLILRLVFPDPQDATALQQAQQWVTNKSI